MRAAVLHGPADLRIEHRPVPEPGPTDVLVEVSHCGVCGTDLHFVIEGWGTPGSVGGHEWSGRVVAVGADAGAWSIGDPVVGGPAATCGRCRGCRSGRLSLCTARPPAGSGLQNGAFAQFVSVDRTALLPVPAGLSMRDAALAEPLAVALHAVTRSSVEAGQRVLVTGAGPIGVLVVVALRSRGVVDVVVSEPNPVRRELAERLGATTVAPAQLVVPSIADPRHVVDGAVDAAIECSGRADAMAAASAQLVPGGTLVLVGTGLESPQFDPNRILLNELVITGSFEYDLDGMADAITLLDSGAIDVDLVTEPDDVSLSGLLPAMHGLAGGTIAGKVLVNPQLEG